MGRTIRTREGCLRKTLPGPAQWSSPVVLTLRSRCREHGFFSGRLEPPLPRDAWVPGPSQGPSLPRLPPMFPTFLIPGVPRGISPLDRQLAGCGRLPPLPLLCFLLLELLHVPLQVPEPGVLFVPAQPVHQGRAKATPEARPPTARPLPTQGPGYLSPESNWQASLARSISDFFISRWSSS